jgi:uncharacterized protein
MRVDIGPGDVVGNSLRDSIGLQQNAPVNDRRLAPARRVLASMTTVLALLAGPLCGTALATERAQVPGNGATAHPPAAPNVPTLGRSVSVPTLGQSALAPMLTDERTAVNAVNQFWTRHFSEYFGRAYHAPKVIGGYTAGNGPRCGGAPAEDFNAFYCKPSDYLAWDQALMSAGYDKIGNAWVYLIIAHEWGHAIQARVNRSLVSQAGELQADCLGAAALTGAVRDGTLQAEPTDAEQISQTLAAAADKYPWTSNRDHGDAAQRSRAFNLGKSQGVKACLS